MIDQHHGWNVSTKPLYIGLVLSLLFIFGAYRVVTAYHLEGVELDFSLLGLAMLQGILQLIFFMHIGLEDKPHWNFITFLFTILVVVIVVMGSIWIMNNLNYNVMPDMK